ncbi:MAG TPA: tetratricopeptide repeat protein [Xanthobacteraceae bacterium]|nr:tetratricopeptide repeat protein [Xanthobacteraceae bacterium]
MNRKERRAAGRQGGGELASLFAAAVRHHQAGELVQAEAGYRGVLAIDPRHGRTLYYLGVLSAQTGRFAAAADLIGRAAALDPRNPELRYNLAAAWHEAGRIEEAVGEYRHAIALKPDYTQAHMNLGNALASVGDTAGALASYDRVLALDKSSAAAHYNAANLLARAGDLAAAAARYRDAIALKPDLAEAHNNLGNVLRGGDRLAEAEAAYRRALALRPDLADAHNNLATILLARGAAEEGLSHCREALRVRPDFAEAHNNLGLALFRAGQAGDATAQAIAHRIAQGVAHLERAIALDPHYVDAYLNLARQLHAGGEVERAVAVAARALAVRETPDARHLFALYAGALPDGEPAERYRDAIVRALREGWASAGELERVSVRLIRRSPAVASLLGAAAAQGTSDLSAFAALADDGLLRSLLAAARVCDPYIEQLLTALRRALLAAATARPAEIAAPVLDLACDLARQCFINEYVFADSAAERETVERLAAELEAALAAQRAIAPPLIVAFACYRALHAIPSAARLLARTWPAAIDELLTQQVREPAAEQAIRATLPTLTTIDDAVSQKVREQYEANPYPRWVAPPPAVRAFSLAEHLRMKFPLAPFAPLGAMEATNGADVLIAGCGTGAHAIDIARRIRGARMLAIDLSRASLAYAARKTRELGLAIDYAQADILRLGAMNRPLNGSLDGSWDGSFDLIEASGVLHHMADPFAGWRVLLGRLRPGGVMSVGLYSSLGRAEINAARAFIAERGYQPHASDIRRCRQDLLALPPQTPGRSVVQSGDFYSLSGCRDLLFHVQEHQHTLPEIATFLADQGLQFLGFEIDRRVLSAYVERHPDDPAGLDLERWQRFEVDHPGVFAAMYQFAVQKR